MKYEIPIDPRVARHLWRYTIAVKENPPWLKDITDLITTPTIDGSDLKYDEQKDTLQYLDDFHGRIVLIDKSNNSGRYVPLSWIKETNKKKVLVLSSSKYAMGWVNVIDNVFSEDKKSIILGSEWREKVPAVDYDQWSYKISDDPRFLLTDYKRFGKFHDEFKPDYVILQEKIDNDWGGLLVQQLCKEYHSFTTVINVQTLKTNTDGKSDRQILESVNYLSSNQISTMLFKNYLGMPEKRNNWTATTQDDNYFLNGIINMAYKSKTWLNPLGVSTHMIMGNSAQEVDS